MAFQFPSVSAVIKGSLDTLKRFLLPLLCAVAGSVICIYIFEQEWKEQKKLEHLWKVVMCCWLGLNLFLALGLISERRNHGIVQKYLLQALALFLLVGYYFFLPEFRKMTATDGIRYALFTIGLHLLVAFAPYIARGEINGFWQFNKTLFLRFLLSALYSCVLFLGLALALLAIDQLFNVNIKDKRYMELWFFISGIFNTWFFLAGIPKNTGELEAITDYPKGLKIFTQFVLLPLVTIYLLILYAYGIKIIIQWELPKGWVSWLVNAFAVFGIFSLLLIYPIRNNEGNTWIKVFSRWFYRALFPLIILLGVAIGKRVMQYGMTENRYFVLIVALWLVGIAIYFLFSKTKNIKLIPISLCITAFLSSFGPWGAFSMSEKSQVSRLEKLLVEENILVNGTIKKAKNTVSTKNGKQIVSIIHYLDQHHDFDRIKPWFKENLDSILAPKDSSGYMYEAGEIFALIGVEDSYYYYRDDEEDTTKVKNFRYYTQRDRQAVSVSGFDYSYNFDQYFYDESNDYNDQQYYQVHFGSDSGVVKYSKDKKSFIFSKNGKDVLYFDVNDYVKNIRSYNNKHKKYQYDQNIPKEMALFEAQNDSVRLKLYVTSISGTIANSEITITDVNGLLLLGFGPLKTDTTHAGITKH